MNIRMCEQKNEGMKKGEKVNVVVDVVLCWTVLHKRVIGFRSAH